MYDRETILKAIDICTIGPECSGCPLKDVTDCDGIIKRGVLNLLRPHVLTLAEADDADVCWYEVKSVDRMPPCRVRWFDGCNEVTVYRFIANPEYPLEEEYCETWRLWSARPSREQREETAWLG